ncbi:MAG: hypothetical protein K8U57_21535 [Planctomycetes bacterium]|nr:hypothetical protein [Planctomycetota bacterium]
MFDLETIVLICFIAWICWNTTRNVKKVKETAESPLGKAVGLGLKRLLK